MHKHSKNRPNISTHKNSLQKTLDYADKTKGTLENYCLVKPPVPSNGRLAGTPSPPSFVSKK